MLTSCSSVASGSSIGTANTVSVAGALTVCEIVSAGSVSASERYCISGVSSGTVAKGAGYLVSICSGAGSIFFLKNQPCFSFLIAGTGWLAFSSIDASVFTEAVTGSGAGTGGAGVASCMDWSSISSSSVICGAGSASCMDWSSISSNSVICGAGFSFSFGSALDLLWNKPVRALKKDGGVFLGVVFPVSASSN